MTAQHIEFQVRDFIFQQFLFDADNGDLQNDVSFLETGIVDSTGVLELLAFLEKTYGITIEDEELVPSNLDSVNNVVSFVTRKLETQSSK
ncbi:MAG: acyl carrier protein [Candidatus Hodarchaeota archaeon]